MEPKLPQSDADAEHRRWGLDEMRTMYSYDHETLKPLAIARRVPSREFFSPDYKGTSDFLQLQFGMAMAAGAGSCGLEPFDSLEVYDRLLASFKHGPRIRGDLMDSIFAQQRLAGVNPMVLRRLDEPWADFPFADDDLFPTLGPGRTIAGECKARRLYVTDYRQFDSIPSGTREGGNKYLPAPIALYAWRETSYGDRGELTPVAIGVRPGLGADRVVVTPRSPANHWMLAKLAVQIADANLHEMSSHLCRTHFVMEPFAISTPRQLAWYHPVFILLRPHLRFMLAQNSYGRVVLMSPGRVVDRLLAGSLDGSFTILKRAYETWSFDRFTLKNELDDRGLLDTSVLPHYPYRDDAVLLWEAIENFVRSYLALYYTTPQDIENDTELQAWAAELASRDGGCVKGFPAHITSAAQLTQVLANVIFTCGPQHSAINFPQWDFMGHVPNMPLAAYAEPMDLVGLTDAEVWLRILPARERTVEQLHVAYTLSAFRHDKLGHYNPADYADPRAQAVIREFRIALYDAESRIQRRNEARILPYPYLQPSLVANSIAI